MEDNLCGAGCAPLRVMIGVVLEQEALPPSPALLPWLRDEPRHVFHDGELVRVAARLSPELTQKDSVRNCGRWQREPTVLPAEIVMPGFLRAELPRRGPV